VELPCSNVETVVETEDTLRSMVYIYVGNVSEIWLPRLVSRNLVKIEFKTSLKNQNKKI